MIKQCSDCSSESGRGYFRNWALGYGESDGGRWGCSAGVGGRDACRGIAGCGRPTRQELESFAKQINKPAALPRLTCLPLFPTGEGEATFFL